MASRHSKWASAALRVHARRAEALAALAKRIEAAEIDDVVEVLCMLERGEFGDFSDVDLAALYSACARAVEALAGSLRQNGGA